MTAAQINFSATTAVKQPAQYNQNTKESTIEVSKNNSSKAKIGLGIGLVCLAASGVYIAAGKNGNVSKIFDTLKDTDSIMNVLEKTKLSKTKFKELMFNITSDEEMSEKFIKEVTSNPRESKEKTRVLNKKFGSDEAMLDWMIKPGGYQEAYYKHSGKVYKNAQKPDDVIGISPNWNIWVMKEKFGNDFSFGELPQRIENADKYREFFCAALNNSCSEHNYPGIVLGDYITGGLSGKAIRKLEIDGKKYILKFQSDMGNADLNDNLSMKSDSTFLNAQLERYLTLNNYNQGPKLKFYDYKTNSALYEMSEGTKPDADSFCDIKEINKKLNDLNSLGVYYNDLTPNNFLVHDNKLNFIDSGESSFVDFFKPGVTIFHFTLPNLNGRNITESASAIALAK